MPFNSSTPKIDGYYNSSILATAKTEQASVKWEALVLAEIRPAYLL